MKNSERGFTLTELLITLAVMAVGATLAIPAYRDWKLQAAMGAASGGFMAAIQAARSHAMATGRSGLVEALAQDWNRGWRVYGDANGNGQWDAGVDTLLLETSGTSPGIVMAAPETASGMANTLAEGYLLFNGQGFPRTRRGSLANGRIELRTPDRLRAIVLHRSGRMRTCDGAGCTPS